MEAIHQAITQARQRIALQNMRDMLLFAALIGTIGMAAVFCLSLWIPIYYDIPIAVGVLLVCLMAGIGLGIAKIPNPEEAAEAADRTGLSEHLVTAWEYRDRDDLFCALQRQETVELMRGFPLSDRLKKKISYRQVGYFCFFLLLSVVLSLLPSAARERAERQHALELAKREEIDKIEEQMEWLKREPFSDETVLQEDMTQIPKELAEALQAPTMTEEERQALTERIEQMLQEGKQEIESASDAGELSDITKRLKKKEEQVASEKLKATAWQEAGMHASGNAANNNGSTGMSGTQNGNKGDQGSSGNSDGQNEIPAGVQEETGSDSEGGESSGNTDGNSSGQNSQNGQSGESGQDGPNGQNGQNGSGNGAGWNQGSNTGLEREHDRNRLTETVIIPGKTVDSGQLNGQSDADGTRYQTQESVLGNGYEGTKLDYNRVVGSYTDKAYRQIEQNEIPASMQDVVKAYFSGIGQ